MRVCILNGFDKSSAVSEDVFNSIKDQLSDDSSHIENLALENLQLQYCKGCFGCWFVNNGKCVMNDSFEEIARSYISSDVAVVLTRVVFGGYEAKVKKVIDKFICLLLPLFEKTKGEYNHKKRYPKNPNLITIGVMENRNAEEAGIFRQLTERNSVNLHADSWYSEVIAESDSYKVINEVIQKAMKKVRG